MITLYQMPASHYCEKIRWALAHKRLPHKVKNLLPGLHIKPMKKLSGQSAVPILKDGRTIIAGSSAIMNHLDATYPRFSLTPENEAEKTAAIKWEAWADSTIGAPVRILIYAALLDRPDILKPIFAKDGPWYKNLYLNKAYPKIRGALEKYLPVNEESIKSSIATLRTAVEDFTSHIEDRRFVVGDSLTRADIAVASLWAPVFWPSGYGVEWPDSMPIELQRFQEQFPEMKQWIDVIYVSSRP